jgi:hypothetical protein
MGGRFGIPLALVRCRISGEERTLEPEGDDTLKKLLLPTAVAAAIALGLATATPARAQAPGGTPLRVPSVVAQSINPNPYIAPGLTLRQYAYNTAVLGRALSKVPPYALGYNPYPPVVNYGPAYGSPYLNPYLNPYLAVPSYAYSSYPSASPYYP